MKRRNLFDYIWLGAVIIDIIVCIIDIALNLYYY